MIAEQTSKKRKENVAEYILLIWQLSDLLRSLKMDEGKIKETLVDPLKLSEKDAQDELTWYLDLANILKEENKLEHGFMSITLYLIGELNDFHQRLLREPSEDQYRMLAFNATPAIVAFKEKVAEPLDNDIEYCFYALYSKMLMGIKKIPITKDTQDAFDEITHLIAYLSKRFNEYEKGTFLFSDEKQQ